MKKCLITCATSELGHFLALSLTKTYDQIILTGRDYKKLAALKSKILEQNQGEVIDCYLDFNSRNSILDLANKIENHLDAIVFITPKIPAKSTSSIPDEEWENLFRITFARPLLLLESLIPLLKKAKRAKVVAISGISSIQYLGNYSINGPIRAAWVAQIKALAQEYGEFGIHFNTLSFGGILTESFIEKVKQEAKQTNQSIESIFQSKYSNVPLRKYASMEDVCNSVNGMLSNATDHMSGQNIICDGGFIRCY